MTSLIQFLDKSSISYESVKLSKITFFRSGGNCDFFIRPGNEDELVSLVKYLRANNIAYQLVGGTANCIFIDDACYTVLISTKKLSVCELVNENSIYASAGVSINSFVQFATYNGLAGVAGLEGIPGTIGAAIKMNAGAYGYEISDYLQEVKILNSDNQIQTLSKDELQFSYRNSLFRNNSESIILGATFEMKKSVLNKIVKEISKYHSARHSYQEFALPNCGSLFSCKKSIYFELLSKNKKNLFIFIICRFIYKNKLVRFIRRKNPDNAVMNNLVFKLLKFDKKYMAVISSKNLNTIVNSSNVDQSIIFSFIKILRERLGEHIKLENEIVRSCIKNEDEVNVKYPYLKDLI